MRKHLVHREERLNVNVIDVKGLEATQDRKKHHASGQRLRDQHIACGSRGSREKLSRCDR